MNNSPFPYARKCSRNYLLPSGLLSHLEMKPHPIPFQSLMGISAPPGWDGSCFTDHVALHAAVGQIKPPLLAETASTYCIDMWVVFLYKYALDTVEVWGSIRIHIHPHLNGH
jgi:hypothetical protein